MTNEEIAIRVYDVIFDELFSGISKENFNLDYYIDNQNLKQNISKVTEVFLDENKEALKNIYNKANRKKQYQDILMMHIQNKYNVILVDESKEKVQNLKHCKLQNLSETGDSKSVFKFKTEINYDEEKNKAKKKKKSRIKHNTNHELITFINEVINSVDKFKWTLKEKVVGKEYETFYKDKKIKLFELIPNKRNEEKITYELYIDGEIIDSSLYNVQILVDSIKKGQADQAILGRFSQLNSPRNSRLKKQTIERSEHSKERIRVQEEKQLLKQQKKQQRRLEKKLKEENERKKEEEHLTRMRLDKENRLLQEQELLDSLPQIGVKDFVVKRAVFKCMHANHKIDNIQAAVMVNTNNRGIVKRKVSAGYCNECQVYFIMESSYESLRNFGIPLCRVSDEKTYLKGDFVNGIQLAQQSILMQYGYNVSQQENLLQTSRQRILAVLIDYKILSKSEIISYLDFFINQRATQSKYAMAISKWETDREFVENYRQNEYVQYGMSGLYRR